MRRNNDRMLLESLVRKYGKNSVKNTIKNINESIDDDFDQREVIYSVIYNALEDACLYLQKNGIEITEDVVKTGVEWFNLHNDFYEV